VKKIKRYFVKYVDVFLFTLEVSKNIIQKVPQKKVRLTDLGRHEGK